jgi:spore germination cell wall hydrolase CwlJ-like protein
VSQGDGTVLFPGVKDPLPLDTIPGRLGWIPAPKRIVIVIRPAIAPVDTSVPATPDPNAVASNPTPSQTQPQPQPSASQPSGGGGQPSGGGGQPQQSQPQQSQPQQSQPQQSQPQQSQPSSSTPSNNNVPPAKPDDGSMEQSSPMNVSESDREVLARIVKGEIGPDAPREGQVAIAAVVLNRVRSGQFGKSIPDVAHAPYQFSCYNSNYRQKLYYGPIPKYAYDAADAALKGENPVPGCTYYFNPFFASPTWAKNMILVKTIGSTKSTRHDFYKPTGGKAKA